MFSHKIPAMAMTLRVLARLLSYPDPDLRQHLGELHDALHAERALAPVRLAELDALIASIDRQTDIDAEADYVQLFDSGHRTSLYLFEHVHGDSRERGPAMIDLAQTFEQAGLYLTEGTLPDYLPVVLEYASTQPAREARAFLNEMEEILNVIFNALLKRHSRYASALGALIELAGGKARPVSVPDDEPIDDAWAEPAAFDGCAAHGQQRTHAAQPIHFVRPTSIQGART
ncbi:MAG: nitrate reductase molybdenum cofactor assembly chaperone [Candidatus Accumulibacter phosphatis]|uniref:Respiratory nitrate reductase delta chain n=1 Tax=Candidatus Accumulibacter phosphatis TaxID=327160 RepID=A0A5S4F7A8_9PROT|nr:MULTISPECIES: nitrate reductase molybdenum cofactor assembly chaperone [Candidatus Accumulibacter]MCQ1551191.1 nitrate reductase molybdenum cofactor assembly chaperone [Candidatus Accumulibacter phosphatis]TMQ76633.1 Respiratory nitrate reductase delta chain [Candidatus Accumulibacter phosphatis]